MGLAEQGRAGQGRAGQGRALGGSETERAERAEREQRIKISHSLKVVLYNNKNSNSLSARKSRLMRFRTDPFIKKIK